MNAAVLDAQRAAAAAKRPRKKPVMFSRTETLALATALNSKLFTHWTSILQAYAHKLVGRRASDLAHRVRYMNKMRTAAGVPKLPGLRCTSCGRG